MKLYHASGLWLEQGDVVLPGSWGRVILGHGPHVDPHLYWRELLFEDVRRRLAPKKPSRLRALFGFSTADSLNRYRQEEPNAPHFGYLLEVPDSTTLHTASLALFNEFRRLQDAASALGLVEQYWAGPVDVYHEVVVGSPATVTATLGTL
jgi:hypothetical protein